MLVLALGGTAQAQTAYDVSGTWKQGAGKKVFLNTCSDDVMDETPIDSAIVTANGTFRMCGSTRGGGLGIVYVAKPSAAQMIYFDGTPVEVDIRDSVETHGRHQRAAAAIRLVEGSKEQRAADNCYKFLIQSNVNEFRTAFAKSMLESTTNTAKRDSLQGIINSCEAWADSVLNAYPQQYGDCHTAVCFMETNMVKPCTPEQIEKFFGQLTTEVQQSKRGKKMAQYIVSLQHLAPGHEAPDFTLPTDKGGTLSLKSLRGKVVIIDFWASWCGPCRAEMPNVKAIYETWHGKGLEVVGVSMDTKEAAWLKAIQQEQLMWHNVSSLKGMSQCPVAKDYEVMAIPKLYIIDRDGKIVDRDLRGDDLRKKVASLFE